MEVFYVFKGTGEHFGEKEVACWEKMQFRRKQEGKFGVLDQKGRAVL